ncbi:PREDICTED: uncharacterized protein LOC108364451 [Rhagoletis zephyria]|uniref:uncharacterized protein LOC108364451 n=1 Tax=Rhagoletis zephyria TaxID=28612 RepID=UPI0008115981|nr:PREDICTED: uncharacterized protein LOC108364451 [Rhagoletis zephyria]
MCNSFKILFNQDTRWAHIERRPRHLRCSDFTFASFYLEFYLSKEYKMHLKRWNIKKLTLYGCGLLILYILIASRYRKYKIDAMIGNSKPEEVWEYVADFSKMRSLNPTILDFKIIADNGHAHEWRYTVVYTERLSHWPYWLNTAKADYIVTKTMPGVEPAIYAIESNHKTCFFKGTYCLHSTSEFKCTASGKDTYCSEHIQYQCPPFLSEACRRELEYQRQAVMHNLTAIFSKNKYSN